MKYTVKLLREVWGEDRETGYVVLYSSTVDHCDLTQVVSMLAEGMTEGISNNPTRIEITKVPEVKS